ncbi:MAG: hypothetical protein MI919_25720 [Holophagales bacterium]|nr:hypothetical protein [Holophagales bacterium]
MIFDRRAVGGDRPSEVENSIREALQPIVGLELCVARRFFEIAIFQLGELTFSTDRRGRPIAHGKFALHVCCPWRLEGAAGILTGYSDMWVLEDPEREVPEGWCFHTDGSLYRTRARQLPGIYDLETQQRQASDRLVVERVESDRYAGTVLELSQGFRIVLFPSGSAGPDWESGQEDWRFFEVGSKAAHWVSSGGKVED